MGKPVRHGSNRRGFTLIELLVTVVILGILVAFAIRAGNPKDVAYKAAAVSDLRNLLSAQEAYYADNLKYAPNLIFLEFNATSGTIDIMIGQPHGWTARLKHNMLPTLTCALFIGGVTPIFAPAVEEGVIACTL